MSRPVITGVGVVSPFGIGTAALFASLERGDSAVGPIRSFDVRSFATQVAGEVPVLEASEAWLRAHASLDERASEVLATYGRAGVFRDRKVAFAVLAALEAWQMARCSGLECHAWSSLALGLEQAFLEDFAPIFAADDLDWRRDSAAPALRYRSRVDLASELIGNVLGLTAPAVVNASACAAGSLSLAHAASLVARGFANLVLCGGADSMVNPLGIGGMTRLGAPSPRNAPDACRPFDRRRDGLVIGEGAAVFVVESEAHANARGAKVLAHILGWGSTQDAYRVTAPRPDGAQAYKAMLKAIARAGIEPEHVHYINAHGTGTPLNDPAEAAAIRSLFGASTDRVLVSSIKGAVGHLMAASGAIEAAACLLPLMHGIVPGTAHHLERDPACQIQVVGPSPICRQIDVALSNSFGFGGQNASIVLGRA
jgi:3-oxoacyl-[acyl-carrier-protein] synthase II